VAGWGAGSFAVTHLHYRKELLSVRQPHSVPLQWLAETGLVGLLLVGGGLLALLAAALARVRETEWRVQGAPAERGAAAALLAIAVAWVAHAFYDWDWDIPAVTLPLLLCLGVLGARRPAVRAMAPAARGPALAAAVVLLVLMAVSAVLPALAETRTASALEIAGADNVTDERLAQAASRAELASRLNPLAVEPLFAVATIAERRGRADEARSALLRALRKQPHNVEGWVRLLRLDFTRLDRSALRRSAIRALELDPANPGTIALARRAWSTAAFPFESATATGSPLPTQVPITDPAAQPLPTPGATPEPPGQTPQPPVTLPEFTPPEP
jgi:tetratricopeptide (TPR) repeat protein